MMAVSYETAIFRYKLPISKVISNESIHDRDSDANLWPP